MSDEENFAKTDYRKMRRAAERARHSVKHPFSDLPEELRLSKKISDNSYLLEERSVGEYITEKIAHADYLMKNGEYFGAYDVLYNLYLSPDYDELKERSKYNTAFLKRLERIIRHCDKETKKMASDLMEEILR